MVRNGMDLSLSWDSATYPGYRVQAQTNNGLGGTWKSTSSTTTSPFNITVNSNNPAVFFRTVESLM